MGVEGCVTAIVESTIPNRIVQHDFTAGPYMPPWPMDMAWSCEFVEHVQEQYAPNFLATFSACRHVALTHALPGQVGHHHVNCQPSEYWTRQLELCGFFLRSELTEELRKIASTRFMRQSLLVFSANHFSNSQAR